MKKRVSILLIQGVFLTFFCNAQLQTISLLPAADATIDSWAPSQNFGNNPYFVAQGSSDQIHGDLRSLIRFDLTSIPGFSDVKKAVLRLYAFEHRPNVNGLLKPLLSPWDEYTVTWTNQPVTSDKEWVLVQYPLTTDQNFELDITNLVQLWIDQKINNYGVIMEVRDESNTAGGFSFHSSNSQYQSIIPVLYVDYEPMHSLTNAPDDHDILFNWVTSRSFNFNGEEISASRSYFNIFGKLLQSQTKIKKRIGDGLNVNRYLIVQEPIYDASGRAALATIPAPVNIGHFSYIWDFITNVKGDHYSYLDFDTPLTKNNPSPIGSNCKLYSYYGPNNIYDTYVDNDLYPFSICDFGTTQAGQPRKVTLAGETHKMGGGKESSTYTVMGNINELIDYNNPGYYQIDELTKKVTLDANQNGTVEYYDLAGNMIASCIYNKDLPVPAQIPEAVFGYFTSEIPVPYFDIHFCGGVIQVLAHTIRVIDLETDSEVLPTWIDTHSFELPPGFYRIQILTVGSTGLGSMRVPESKYADFQYFYYDVGGRLIKQRSPMEIASAGNDPMPEETKYDSRGLPVWNKSADKGESYAVYRRDGLLRFSQNSNQAITNEYSYINYDQTGRPTETGVYHYIPGNPDAFSPNMPSSMVLNPSNCTERSNTEYDLPSSALSTMNIPSSYMTQHFLVGNVAVTRNEYAATYYSYDDLGRIEWTVLTIPDLPPKTFSYFYDVDGNLQEMKLDETDQGVALIHSYEYNPTTGIQRSKYQVQGQPEATSARYKYYKHGALKRKEIGHGTFSSPVQGIDFTYNINGWLKAINSPSSKNYVYLSDDPGKDYNDFFGMALDYYPGDYKREVSNLMNILDGNGFNGLISAFRWKIQPGQVSATPQQVAYTYRYDYHKWLQTADLNMVETSFKPLPPTITVTTLLNYREEFSYDQNGNIRSAVRNGDDNSPTLDNLQYKYDFLDVNSPLTSTIKSNRLYHVNDAQPLTQYPDDMEDQGIFNTTNITTLNNYLYDNIGRLIKDKQSASNYYYYSSNKLKSVAGTSGLKSYSWYDEAGFRIKKAVITGSNVQYTWYVRDINGTILAIYEGTGINNSTFPNPSSEPRATEYIIYGDGKLGVLDIASGTITYELTDHLGSIHGLTVRAPDYEPTLTGYSNYYAYGMKLPGKSLVSQPYRFGYQGQFAEKDQETGFNHFELRDYDSRLGRWMIADPAHQYNSPYMGMGNNPVSGVDPDGAFFQELKNWALGRGWMSNDAYRFMLSHPGATYNGWTGNKLTGYANIGFSETFKDALYGTMTGVGVAAFSAVQDIPHFRFFNGPFIGNVNNKMIGVTDLFDGSSFTPNSHLVITGDKHFKMGGLNHYRHEFGHAMICGEKGIVDYYVQDAIPSVVNFAAEGTKLESFFGGPHSTYGPEVDADRVGQQYFGKFNTPVLNPNR